MTEPKPLQQTQRTYVLLGRRKLSYFSGCDYYRLSSHPAVTAALVDGLKRYGLSVAASRLTTGNHVLYRTLEQQLVRCFDAEDALLTSSGYATNLIVAQALAGAFSHALLDERSHASLADAAGLLECPVLRFRHRDASDLAKTVRRCGPHTRLIVLTDGMFSHDGSVAPLKEYLRVLPKNAVILVDDAHGAGVVGRTGKGSLEVAGVKRGRIIQTIALSKAFGAHGGAVLGTKALRRRILERSRLFATSTPLPLPLVCAAGKSLALLKADRSLRRRLHANTACVRGALNDAGGPRLPETPGPIVSLVPGTTRMGAKWRRKLLAAGIFPPFLRYPGGAASGYFRFVISSEHSRAQLDRLIRVLRIIIASN